MDLHRVFIAINLPEKVKQELVSYQENWLSLPARWTKQENLHITLVFIGNANSQEVADICAEACNIAKEHEPFVLSLDKIVYGPIAKSNPAFSVKPRMVWALGKENKALTHLQQSLKNYFFEPNPGAKGNFIFTPHVTMARVMQFGLKKLDKEEIPTINETISFDFMVNSIEVMESELKRGGPIYTVLESAGLGQ